MSGNLRADTVGLALSGGILSLKGVGLTSPNCLCGGLYSLPDGTTPCYWDISTTWSSGCFINPPEFAAGSFSITGGSAAFRMYLESGIGTCQYIGFYGCAGTLSGFTDSACMNPALNAVSPFNITAAVTFVQIAGGSCQLFFALEFGNANFTFVMIFVAGPSTVNCTGAPFSVSGFAVFGPGPGLPVSATISPSSSTIITPCPAQMTFSGICPPGYIPPIGPPRPPPALPLYPSCPNDGTCDSSQINLCIKAATAGLFLSDGTTRVSSDITVMLSAGRSCAFVEFPPIWFGAAGNASAMVTFSGIFGSASPAASLGNFVVTIVDELISPGTIIWAGCLDTLTVNYSLITAFMPALTVNTGISTVAVSAGPCPPCALTSCNLGLYLSAYNLALAAGTINGTKVSDTTGCLGLSFFSQSSLTWTAQNLTMNQVFGLCQWTEATVPVSTTLTTIYYAADGVTVLCTTSSSYNPGWAIRLNTVDDGGGPGAGTLGYWQLEGSISGLAPGMPNFPNGVNGQIWENLCANPGPIGTYSLGSVVS